MWGAIIGAAAKMIGGAVVNGITAYNATKEKVAAYKNAALDIRNATELYSGANLNSAMTEKGIANAAERNAQAMGAAAGNFDGSGSTKMANFMPLKQNVINSDKTTDAYNTGANRAQQEANAKYDAATKRAEQVMKQADIDYNVKNQIGQTAANAAGSLVDLAGQIGGMQENK
ncbi:MAG: hypothetical protein J6R32_02530 [Bacteroidales bacterium]|nr:hypothetical protein [Bacteroidales bacterium]